MKEIETGLIDDGTAIGNGLANAVARIKDSDKYTVDDDDAIITIYYKNDAGKWVPNGETTTHTSTTLFDDPYSHITPTQDASVKTDFYVTYDVKSSYAKLYSGAATKEATNASTILLKQGNQYAVNSGNTLTAETPDAPPSVDSVEDTWK